MKDDPVYLQLVEDILHMGIVRISQRWAQDPRKLYFKTLNWRVSAMLSTPPVGPEDLRILIEVGDQAQHQMLHGRVLLTRAIVNAANKHPCAMDWIQLFVQQRPDIVQSLAGQGLSLANMVDQHPNITGAVGEDDRWQPLWDCMQARWRTGGIFESSTPIPHADQEVLGLAMLMELGGDQLSWPVEVFDHMEQRLFTSVVSAYIPKKYLHLAQRLMVKGRQARLIDIAQQRHPNPQGLDQEKQKMFM